MKKKARIKREELIRAALEDAFNFQIETVAFLLLGQLLDDLAAEKKRKKRKLAFQKQAQREREREREIKWKYSLQPVLSS